MNLDSLAAFLVDRYGAVLVVVYGSYASGTADDHSDVDLVAWAPVASPVHDTSPWEGHDLDAWVYPLDHPPNPDLVRVHPAVCLVDTHGRFAALQDFIEAQRVEAQRPWDDAARNELAAWARKMVQRARSGTPEGLQRYHWLVAELPELWCRFRGVPWEGPKKALGRMRNDDPQAYADYQALVALSPDPEALGRWVEGQHPTLPRS